MQENTLQLCEYAQRSLLAGYTQVELENILRFVWSGLVRNSPEWIGQLYGGKCNYISWLLNTNSAARN